MLGKIYNNFSDIPYNNELQQYEVFVGDQVYSGNIDDSEIQFSEEITYETDDSAGYTQYIFTFAKTTTIYNHATIEIDSQEYIFEIKPRSVTINRSYYSTVEKDKERIFESNTYHDIDCPNKIKISTNNYKYYTVTDNNLDNNNQSFSISNDNQYIILNSEYDNIILSITYDRLLSAVSYYYYYGTTDEIPDLESESKNFYFLEQYKVKAPYIESFTAVYPAEDEYGYDYQEEDILIVPEDLQGGGSIKLYYFYKNEQSEPKGYKMTIHHLDWDTGETIYEDTYKNVKETEQTNIQSYQKIIQGYSYYWSYPTENFYPIEDTEITLYYQRVEIPYTLYVHQVKLEDWDEFEDTAQYNNLPADRVIVISEYVREWPGYVYKSSSPSSNFEMQEQATNYEVHLYLYYEEQPRDPCESECQNCEGNVCLSECQTSQSPPPEEEKEDILFGWMTNGKGKFAPKTLGENFITDAESKARVFQYGTFIPSKLQKGAIYFVI